MQTGQCNNGFSGPRPDDTLPPVASPVYHNPHPIQLSTPMTSHARPYAVDKYKARQSFGLGIALIVVGVLSIIFNIVDIVIYHDIVSHSYSWSYYYSYFYGYDYYDSWSSNGYAGHGFWCGLMYIMSGTLGIKAGNTKARCPITAFLIFTVMSTVLAGVQFIIGATGSAASHNALGRYGCNEFDHSGDRIVYRGDGKICEELRTLVAMEALEAAMAAFAFGAALWGSILCCHGNCSTRPYVTPYYSGITFMQPQMTVITTTQQGQPGTFQIPAGYPVAGYNGYPPPTAQCIPTPPSYAQAASSAPPSYDVLPPTTEYKN